MQLVWGKESRQRDALYWVRGQVNLRVFYKNLFTDTNLLCLLNPNMSPEDSLGDPSVAENFSDGVSVVRCADPWRALPRAA